MRGRALFSPCVLDHVTLSERAHFQDIMKNDNFEVFRFLHYEEEGLFYTHRGALEFYRDYIYAFFKNDAFSIYFARNKMPQNLFMTFQDKHTQLSHHQCLNDHYEGEFQKINKTSFQFFYRVKGPRKDYTLKTLYERHSYD